jgi:transglutaminase-like putative cysteine protease
MRIERATPFNEWLAKLIFLMLPTSGILYVLLWNLSAYIGIIGDPNIGLFSFLPAINNISFELCLFTSLGMFASSLFHAFRFRFLPIFLLLISLLYSVYKGLDNLSTGEFDAFFISIQFLSFTALFSIGWLLGYGFTRFRYSSVFVSSIMLVACVLLIAKANNDTVLKLMQAFSPALLYSVYIIFTTEQIYSYKDKSQKFWWFLSRRVILFGLLSLLLLAGVYFKMQKEIEDTVANYGGGGKGGKNSMLKKNKNGTFDLNDYSRLSSSLERSNELLFCAHINNYFPGTDVPNPLYLTAFYYTKFDTSTETFERDTKIPNNDLFQPDPSKIALFFTQIDSSVIRNSLSTKFRHTVDVEIYSKQLSPNTYLAPHTGFFVQPITVEKDFKEEFKSAYRSKGYVSDLNSAYFIYNAQDSGIRQFQELRFQVLRSVKDYDSVDETFMRYYTFMPSDAKFQSISRLARQITENATTPVDKILAIRDWFLSKDENGEPLFKYTNNPGIPDIPSASKLSYFLFENHKGYCAYYAGATLFMLRALGIPSRIAVGFLTVDRSDKNKGWYWYYADQAHAWVQVYFPGYGWLDFDTTVGNSDAQESPKPDGTPPMQPPRAWVAIDGWIEQVDTLKKQMKFHFNHIIFHDKEYIFNQEQSLEMDLKIASIKRDSMDVPLSDIQKGDSATVVSYAETFKKMETGNESMNELVKHFPSPSPIDEVYLRHKYVHENIQPAVKEAKEKPFDWRRLGIISLSILATLCCVWLVLPWLVFLYYQINIKRAIPSNKPYWMYRIICFYLHQLGVYRNELTPMQFARDVVDKQYKTQFSAFMSIYLKQKYAKQVLCENELNWAQQFYPNFMKKIKDQLSWKNRWLSFLKPLNTIQFFNHNNEDNA